MKYSLLLFDLDGTLVDSRRDLAEAVNVMLQNFGVRPLDQSTIIDAVGDGVATLIERCLERAGVLDIPVDIAKPFFVDYYTRHLADYTRPYSGVPETLQALGGITKAVVSNKLESLSRQLLEYLELSKYFELISGGDTFTEKKPSAVPILEVCARFGVDPTRALLVGDSVNDIRAAKSAGIDSAAVLYGLQPADALKKEQATYYLLNFKDILALVKD